MVVEQAIAKPINPDFPGSPPTNLLIYPERSWLKRLVTETTKHLQPSSYT